MFHFLNNSYLIQSIYITFVTSMYYIIIIIYRINIKMLTVSCNIVSIIMIFITFLVLLIGNFLAVQLT